MNRFRLILPLIFLACGTGCKKEGEAAGGNAVDEIVSPEQVPVASELGFAVRVPADSDFFFSAHYDGKGMMEGIIEAGLASGLMEKPEVKGETEEAEEPEDLDFHKMEESLRKAAGYLGSEVFVFSGPGVGDKLTMVGTTYRDLSAAWGGFVVGTVLDTFAKDGKEPDLDLLGEGLSEDLLQRWLSVIEKDAKLQIPSVVMGWQPGEERREECLDEVAGMLAEIFEDEEGAQAVSFESNGATMSGFEVLGTEVFGDLIEEMREAIAEKAEGMTYGKGLSAARIGQFLSALEGVRFTVAAGTLDGRVLVYFGDGGEGFKLAATPEDSLAAREDLAWLRPLPGKRLLCAGYLSETMVGSVLPWLDNSKYWNAMAGAIRAPIVEQELFRDLLRGLSETSGELAQRDVSAWAGAVYSGDGWTVLTRGGIIDPSIDFEAPLKMVDAVGGMKPAFRGHWVQKRGWNDLSWKQTEHLGFILDAVGREFLRNMESRDESDPGTREMMAKVSGMIQGLNRGYREEFRNGIGDEVAFFGDFLGEIPPVPVIVSDEMIRDFTMPRFVYARPVTDRAMVSKAGKTMVAEWTEMVAEANRLYGDGLPLFLPQLIESNDLATWYAPLPFIGGDFIPGVSVDDRTWMMGTSRELAGGLAKGMKEKPSSSETGVIVEMDFDALGEWIGNIYEKGKDDAEEMAGAELDAGQVELIGKSADGAMETFSKLKGLRYRHWMEAGVPRTSLEVRLDE